jgi:hypothetical protein
VLARRDVRKAWAAIVPPIREIEVAVLVRSCRCPILRSGCRA